jgi:hypothetical protein
MRRNTRVICIFRSKIDLTNGPYTVQNSTPMTGNVNAHGALWTTLMGAGPGGVGFGTLTFAPDNADGVAVSATNTDLLTIARNTLFDGNDWDRSYSASGANLGTLNSTGAALTALPGNWSVTNAPAATTQATITRAGVAGKRLVCTSIAAAVSAVAAQGPLVLVLRDGASGVGAILWSVNLGGFVIGTGGSFSIDSLNIVGTAGNSMTLEFTAAPAATNFETVALTGYDATDVV